MYLCGAERVLEREVEREVEVADWKKKLGENNLPEVLLLRLSGPLVSRLPSASSPQVRLGIRQPSLVLRTAFCFSYFYSVLFGSIRFGSKKNNRIGSFSEKAGQWENWSSAGKLASGKTGLSAGKLASGKTWSSAGKLASGKTGLSNCARSRTYIISS
jgi:hypothetical protein